MCYCYECQANLCKMYCKIIHAVQTHRDHCIISTAEGSMVNGTDEIKNIIQKYLICSKHPDKAIRFECKDDSEYCCSDCVVLLHSQCREIIDIKENTAEQTHEIISKPKDNIGRLRTHIEAILDAKRLSELQSTNDAENIESKLREMRAKVNNLFDVLEKAIGQQCKAYLKKTALYITEDKKELESSMSRLKNCSALIVQEILTQLPTELAHVVLDQVKIEFKRCETVVLKVNHGPKQNSLHLQISDVLNSMISIDPNETGGLATIKTKVSYITRLNPNIYGFESPIFTGLMTLSNNQLLLVDSFEGHVILVSEDLKLGLAEFDFMNINIDIVKEIRKPGVHVCVSRIFQNCQMFI